MATLEGHCIGVAMFPYPHQPAFCSDTGGGEHGMGQWSKVRSASFHKRALCGAGYCSSIRQALGAGKNVWGEIGKIEHSNI